MNELLTKVINSFLAGLLVTLGGCASGEMSLEVVYFAVIAGAIVAVTQFKEDFSRTKGGKARLFSFV